MIFPDLDLTLRLGDLKLRKVNDRWFGVEPYAMPVFFKIDGENYRIRIDLPGPGSGGIAFDAKLLGPGAAMEVVGASTDLPQFDDSPDLPPVDLFDGPGETLIGGQSFDRGDVADMSRVRFRTTLKPIPLEISVGSQTLVDAIGGELPEDIDTTIDAVIYDIERTIEFLFDIEVHGTCPHTDTDSLLNELSTIFRTAVPGVAGGVITMAENDDFAEHDARSIQAQIAAIVQEEIRELLTTAPLVGPPGTPTVSEWEALSLGLRLATFGAGGFALGALGWGIVGGLIGFAVGGFFVGIIGFGIGLALNAVPDRILLVNGEPASIMVGHLDFWDPVTGRLTPSTDGKDRFNDDVPPLQERNGKPENKWTLHWKATAEVADT
jgi:hypothetical protein